jgi:hypothetical protein
MSRTYHWRWKLFLNAIPIGEASQLHPFCPASQFPVRVGASLGRSEIPRWRMRVLNRRPHFGHISANAATERLLSPSSINLHEAGSSGCQEQGADRGTFLLGCCNAGASAIARHDLGNCTALVGFR